MRKITIFILLLFTSIGPSWNINAQNREVQILENFNSQTGMKSFSTFISETTIPLSAGVPLCLGVAALINHDDEMLKNSLYIGASQAVTIGTTYLLKYTINRSRPYETYPHIIPYKLEPSPAMPSGHTSIAFSTATSLSLKYPKWYVIAPSFLWASSVGYSRMNLGVHYPSDVLAGALLGAGSAYLTKKLNDLFWEKKNHKQILSWENYPF